MSRVYLCLGNKAVWEVLTFFGISAFISKKVYILGLGHLAVRGYWGGGGVAAVAWSRARL